MNQPTQTLPDRETTRRDAPGAASAVPAAPTLAHPGPRAIDRSDRGPCGRAAAVVLAMIAAISWLTPEAAGQGWPDRTVRIVVGQTPGSVPDLIGRMLAEHLGLLWQQPVVVENRSGAGGNIAADLVAKAPADGYTLLLGGHSNLAVAAALDASLRYDPRTDFAPIARIAHCPYFVVVNTAVPARTVAELVAEARTHPKRFTFVSYGEGAGGGLAFRLLMAATDVELLEIPYKGVAQANADLVAGRVDMATAPLAAARQLVAAGPLRILAATGTKRARAASDIATIAEQGVPGIAVDTWYGLVAPAGIPADVRARLVDALGRIGRLPDAMKRLELLDCEPVDDLERRTLGAGASTEAHRSGNSLQLSLEPSAVVVIPINKNHDSILRRQPATVSAEASF